MNLNRLVEILKDAEHEINSLRRKNEILSAKVEVMDSFMCVLHTKPAEHQQASSPDLVFQIAKVIDNLERGTP